MTNEVQTPVVPTTNVEFMKYQAKNATILIKFKDSSMTIAENNPEDYNYLVYVAPALEAGLTIEPEYTTDEAYQAEMAKLKAQREEYRTKPVEVMIDGITRKFDVTDSSTKNVFYVYQSWDAVITDAEIVNHGFVRTEKDGTKKLAWITADNETIFVSKGTLKTIIERLGVRFALLTGSYTLGKITKAKEYDQKDIVESLETPELKEAQKNRPSNLI